MTATNGICATPSQSPIHPLLLLPRLLLPLLLLILLLLLLLFLQQGTLQVVTATDGICVTAVTGSIQPHFPIPLTHNPTISPSSQPFPSFLQITSSLSLPLQPLMHKLILSCGFPNRGFGFVTFADTEGVDKVLEFGTHELDGKKVV